VRFAPHTEDDISEMLAALGLSSLDELFGEIPADVRLDRPLNIPDGVSEMELIHDMRTLAAGNRSADQLVCFAGGGAYDHYIPSVVWALAGRSEFYTSYTPYQPELSQGVLQTLFEFQSMICELTGLEVSNASLYDGATALVEAVNMARGHGRERVLVSGAVDPRLVDTLRAYGRGAGYEPEVFPVSHGRGGDPDVGPDVAAVVVQHPNVYGVLEPVRDLFGRAHDGGARAIQVFDPLSLGVLAPPGELGADIAVAEGQTLGNHLNYGGPYLGLIAARLDDVRRMPGRIVGETLDVDGKTGYVLTLQAREQHIRREKANSNICTNQTLMAVAATVYLGWLGPAGLAELGRQCASKAAYAAGLLTAVDGVELLHPDAPFFKEFTLRLPSPAAQVRDALVDRGFLAGIPLADAEGRALAVAVTEKRSRDEIDRFADAFADVLKVPA
jgi:glycine dehydrogenase subunit 1